jgi:outer membrane protein insertion porin family
LGGHLGLNRFVALCLAAACATATSSIALAQAQQTGVQQAQFTGGIISEIVVEGTQRIEPSTVRSYLSVIPGDPFNAERIDQSLKSLFATGLFADVALRREGDTLIVSVVENPIINRIAFEGNRRIEDEDLEREVQLRPRVVYTRTRVQNDVQRILEIYRRTGRFAATVEPKVIPLDQNRVDLVFEIDEGPRTGVRRISFIGNQVFSDGRLREEIQTRESRWYRFLTSDDSYDPDRLTFDRELLRRFYLSRGYADFRVVSAVAELTPDREDFFITFTIEEGERYKFGSIDIATELTALDPEQLRSVVTTTEGDWYDARAVEDTSPG